MKTKHKLFIILGVILLGFSVILTFVILSDTLSKPINMQLSMPDKSSTDTTKTNPKDVVEIIVIKNPNVYFESKANGEKGIAAINSAILKTFLEKQSKSIGKDKCVIKITANKDARYRDMVDLLDLFSILEFKRYALNEISEKDLATLKEYQLSHKNY